MIVSTQEVHLLLSLGLSAIVDEQNRLIRNLKVNISKLEKALSKKIKTTEKSRFQIYRMIIRTCNFLSCRQKWNDLVY